MQITNTHTPLYKRAVDILFGSASPSTSYIQQETISLVMLKRRFLAVITFLAVIVGYELIKNRIKSIIHLYSAGKTSPNNQQLEIVQKQLKIEALQEQLTEKQGEIQALNLKLEKTEEELATQVRLNALIFGLNDRLMDSTKVLEESYRSNPRSSSLIETGSFEEMFLKNKKVGDDILQGIIKQSRAPFTTPPRPTSLLTPSQQQQPSPLFKLLGASSKKSTVKGPTDSRFSQEVPMNTPNIDFKERMRLLSQKL